MAVYTSMRAYFGAGVLGFLAGHALADVAPPPDYVEKCTIEEQQGAGDECQPCGASFQGREKCTALGAEGYKHRCKAHGASVWTEVWCRSKAPIPAPGGDPGADGLQQQLDAQKAKNDSLRTRIAKIEEVLKTDVCRNSDAEALLRQDAGSPVAAGKQTRKK